MITNSSHPDFPTGMKVICIRPQSRFYGQQGVVCGSGPSKKHPTNDAATVFVKWNSGDRLGYFPSRLATAALDVREYKAGATKKSKTSEGAIVSVTSYVVPASKRVRPTLAVRMAAAKSSASVKEEDNE